jgi:hypothetical protein
VPPRQSIPKYREHNDNFLANIYRANENYYRDLAAYTRTCCLVRRVAFSVVNAGEVTALDVRVLIDVPDTDGVHIYGTERFAQRAGKRVKLYRAPA